MSAIADAAAGRVGQGADEAAGLLRGRLHRHDRPIYGPAEDSFLAEMVGLAGVDVITGDQVDLRDPAREAHRADPGGDHPRRQRVLRADARDVAKRDRLER